MKSKKIIALEKGVWAFCSYVFVTQRRPKHPEDVGITEIRKHGFTELGNHGKRVAQDLRI